VCHKFFYSLVAQVQFVVNTKYNTTFGWQKFSETKEVTTKKNQVTFPLYNRGAVYNITLLVAGDNQCLQQKLIVTNLPGHEGQYTDNIIELL